MDSVQKHEVHVVPPGIVTKAAALALGALALWGLISAISGLQGMRYIGAGINPTNTIAVTGQGEVFAIPDTAEFSVMVSEDAKDVQTAQASATKKGNDIIAYVKSQGVEEKDIKTTDYSVNPKYSYEAAACKAGYCPPGKQVLDGYTVSQTFLVKVRDTTKAGAILSGVGTKGASSVSGISFTVADQDQLESQARAKAIEAAKVKAEVLARQLGVSIVRVVAFNESGNYPMYATKAMDMRAGGAMLESAPAPEIPVGQNKISSDVSVTYEIR
jgi:uncharacterized protein YggE